MKKEKIKGVPILKYRINALLGEIPKANYGESINSLYEITGVPKRTMDRYRTIRQKESADVPGKVLRTVAEFLSLKLGRTITMDDLFTPEKKPRIPKPLNPQRENLVS